MSCTLSLCNCRTSLSFFHPNSSECPPPPAPLSEANNSTFKPTIEKILLQYKHTVDRNIEKWFPRKFDEKTLRFFCGSASYKFDADAATQAIAVPAWDILDRGGKRWRPVLMILTAQAYGQVSEETMQNLLDLACLCEVLHNGSLIIDDVEDNSELRRGKPCVHNIYGVDLAINAGNALYFLSMLVLRELRSKLPAELALELYDVVMQECVNLHFGQGMDIYWHQKQRESSPTTEEYLQMCAMKTGALARLSAKLGILAMGADKQQAEVFGKFGEVIGVAFQIQDDMLNLIGEKFTTSVTGEDITEGKRSLMVIHCLQHASRSDAERLSQILEMHTRDRALIDEAIQLLLKNGSVEFARSEAKRIITTAWDNVEPYISDPASKANLKAFADFLIERDI